MQKTDNSKLSINLNNLLTQPSKSALSESLNDILSHRFLTKSDLEKVYGFIGNYVAGKSVEEPDLYARLNQLQPMIKYDNGTEAEIYDFQNILNLAERSGIDISQFDSWGKSLQFNWVPPIDIDKFINFRNYYWNGDGEPDYVTVKNVCNVLENRAVRDLRDISESFVNISGVVIDGKIICDRNARNAILEDSYVVVTSQDFIKAFKVNSVILPINSTEIEVQWDDEVPADGTIVSLVPTLFKIISLNTLTNSIVVSGDLTDILTVGYLVRLSTLEGTEMPMNYEVLSFQITPDGINTEIRLNPPIVSPRFSRIDISVGVRLKLEEQIGTCSDDVSFAFATSETFDILPKLIWNRKLSLSDIFNVSITSGADYITLPADIDITKIKIKNSALRIRGDFVKIFNGPEAGEYEIVSVNTLTRQVGIGKTLFPYDANIQIFRKNNYTTITNPIADPVEGDYWLDLNSDVLRYFDGLEWKSVEGNIGVVTKLVGDRVYINSEQSDSWSTTNRWTHKRDLLSITGLRSAKAPIIEFDGGIDMVNYSISSKEWEYRPNTSAPYSVVTEKPTLFESTLVDYTNFTFSSDARTITFSPRIGDLTKEVKPGDFIRLVDFVVNSGLYQVQSVKYEQSSPTELPASIVTLVTPLRNFNDRIPPSNKTPHIGPELTSFGDQWISFDAAQWRLNGVSNINPTSFVPQRNTLLDSSTIYSDGPVVTQNNLRTAFRTKTGLFSCEYNLKDSSVSVTSAILIFPPNLQNICLNDDYQEGDIRVFINGVRQYSNFTDLSAADDRYVGAIRFDNTVTISSNDKIRIELGEIAAEDIGKRDRLVNTFYGKDYFNLVSYRIVEQKKTDPYTGPLFSVYNSEKMPVDYGSRIFEYAIDPDQPIDPDLGARALKNSRGNYIFNNLTTLNGKLVVYKNNFDIYEPYKTIWRRGANLEAFVQQQVSGKWNVPSQMFYNPTHENPETVSNDEIYKHFRSILEYQNSRSEQFIIAPLSGDINYGVGGYIKEHNDQFDLFVASLLSCNYTVSDLIKFMGSQYDLLTYSIISEAVSNFNAHIIANSFNESVISTIEINDSLSKIYGDSTTYIKNGDIGVRNWVPSLAFFGLVKKTQPYFFEDGSNIVLVKHDGSRFILSTLGLNLSNVINQAKMMFDVVTSLPDSEDYEDRAIVVYDDQIYINNLTSLSWDAINLIKVIGDMLVDLETRLFNACPIFDDEFGNFSPTYDIYDNSENAYYIKHINLAAPNDFVIADSDAFTWNYFGVTPNNSYVSGTTTTPLNLSGYNAIYKKIFGTAYPHREPWFLQGYTKKPDWWDIEYRDQTGSRYWQGVMWDNVVAGIVPVNKILPTGFVSTGVSNETTTYIGLPINITSANIAGYEPDDLLPPAWDSSLSSDARVFPMVDADGPFNGYSEPHTYSSGGVIQTRWQESYDYLINLALASYFVDPIKFVHGTYGNRHDLVECLQIDKRTGRVSTTRNLLFHGQLVDNEILQYNGLNQILVQKARYEGIDNFSSSLFDKMISAYTKLGYNTNTIVDENTLTLIGTSKLTERDYDVEMKAGTYELAKTFSAVNAVLLETPSRFARSREYGIGWKTQLSTNTPNGEFTTVGMQNYNFINTGTAGIYEIDAYIITDTIIDLQDSSTEVTLFGDLRSRLFVGDFIEISGNEFVLTRVIYVAGETKLFFNDTTQQDFTGGKLIPVNRRKLPNWSGNNELIIRSTKPFETEFDQNGFYYVRKIEGDDYRFELFDGPINGSNSFPVVVDIGEETVSIGNPKASFSTRDFDGWINYEIDADYTIKLTSPVVCDTLQTTVDMLRGYYEYLYSIGIRDISEDGENLTDGRPNDWQLEVEKFLEWAYLVRREKIEDIPFYTAEIDVQNNTLILDNSYRNHYKTGDSIIITRNILGERIESTYFVIKTLDRFAIRIATDSYSAKIGRNISLSGFGTDINVTGVKASKSLPVFEINPYRNFIHVETQYGILDNIYAVDCKPEFYGIYDNLGNRITIDKIVSIRNDIISQFRLTENLIDSNKKISLNPSIKQQWMSFGSFDVIDFNHVIFLENTAVNGDIHYNSFLGVRTNGVLVDCYRRKSKTGRPVMGGYSLSEDGDFLPNIENGINSVRFYYDRYKNINPISFENLLNTIGYNGDFDYLDDLGFTNITKFELWRGFLQNKGTNFSIDAFTNNKTFENVSVDEFWAYKQSEFGDAKARVYPEMYAKHSETVGNDVRYEFVAPDEAALDSSFNSIKLTDIDRWYIQPDQIQKMQPYNSFFFEADPVIILEHAEILSRVVTTNTIDDRLGAVTSYWLDLGVIVDGVLVTALDVNGQRQTVVLGDGYTLPNSKTLKFTTSPAAYDQLRVIGFYYSKHANNPAKLVDTKSNVTISDIEIWNPAAGQYYSKANSIVDIFNTNDMAVYNNDGQTGVSRDLNNYWADEKEGFIWADMSNASYVPYYDVRISGGLEKSLFNWGLLSDWGDVALYRWTRSPVAPTEWELYKQSNKDATGTVKLELYENIGTLDSPLWIMVPKQINFEYTTGIVYGNQNFSNPISGIVEVYVNGKYKMDLDLSVYSLNDFADPDVTIPGKSYARPEWNEGDIITIRNKKIVPTELELRDLVYKYDAPYTLIYEIEGASGVKVPYYYFWVRNSETPLQVNGVNAFTHAQAESYLKNIPEPYMILSGFRSFEAGYGLIYGISFDSDDYGLPNRYTRVCIRGIDGMVTDDRRYTIRWTRDMTLRDGLNIGDLSLKNKHTEWKVFRKNQPNRVDRYLWDRLQESAVGYRVINGIIPSVNNIVPSRERVLYDTIYNTKSRYGLGKDSVMLEWIDIVEVLEFNAEQNIQLRELISSTNFEILSNRLNVLETIYNTFSVEEINSIYFDILHIFMSKTVDNENIMKTSWVAIDIDSNVITEIPFLDIPPVVESSDLCRLNTNRPVEETPIIEEEIPEECVIVSEIDEVIETEIGEDFSPENC